MCDEFTAADVAAMATLDRRSFATAGAGLVGLALVPGCHAQTAPAGLATKSRAVTITTPDGIADAFFVAPASGRHPAVLWWPDIAGLRDTYKTMATRLAAEGYAVLVLNHYYRSSPAPVLNSLSDWFKPDGQKKLEPMIKAITPAGTERDAKAAIAWLDTQPEVDTAHKVGTQGYCMGGPYTVRTAHAVPGRVGAAASFHGGGLVTAEPDSPHQLIKDTQAAFLFAVARNDDARASGDKDALRTAAAAAGRPAEIEVYAADHGWCTLDAPTYNLAEAERAHGRLLVLYQANL